MKIMDPMKMALKKEEETSLERLLRLKIEQRRINLINEISWITKQQKIAKTKGFVNFNKQLNRTDFVEHSNKVYPRAHDDRFVDKEIPKIYSRFSNAGQAVIPYDKQLPRETKISASQLSSFLPEDDY